MEAHTTTSLTGGLTPGQAPRLPERPVFVSDHGRRHALIRAMIVLGATLIAAWLIALVVGALGWGRLPGVPFSASSDHGRTVIGRENPGADRAATQRRGSPGAADRVGVTSSAGGGRASSARSRSLTSPYGSRHPSGAPSTPTKVGGSAGKGSQQGPGSPTNTANAPAGSAASGGTGQSSGSSGGTASPGATTPGNGGGSGSGNGGNASSSTPPPQSGQPALTPSGNVPAQDAYGGNPNALAYGRGGNSSR